MLSGGAEVSSAGRCGFWNRTLGSLHPGPGESGFPGRVAQGWPGLLVGWRTVGATLGACCHKGGLPSCLPCSCLREQLGLQN